ncbi:MAG: 16S rRNA (cytosine(967)-C(5))-methyltransferase [Gammaproteobacteria bacterium]|nr:16S rRNA (cytosine(967)-C(5))-methyltransferase [Gammaproteobacteria bacterium]|tara:strand:+ start:2663 stop:4003 length:1341 start_codon:yes stop_codon:yes gene_type:complete
MKPAKVRATAAQILARLLRQQGSLASLLPRASDVAAQDQNQMSLLRELCFGTCRWYHKLNLELSSLIDKPLKNKDLDIHCLLLVGMYQLEHMRLADHAAVSETVNATVILKKGWAKSLVNGVLRQYQRKRASTDHGNIDPTVTTALTYADWLVDAIRTDWPQQSDQILSAGNQHPPMTLRVNLARVSRAAYLDQLAIEGIEATPGNLAESAIYLTQGRAVNTLPGFSDALVSVQDEASQLIPGLLAAGGGQRILDACAAPGGKTCHVLETLARHGDAPHTMLALDIEARRLGRIEENLQRLMLASPAVHLQAADSSEPASWWDATPFDRILLDAPCSATGIIRRQPDIKVLRQADDVSRLAALQHKLLASLWPCLAPGGMMLYSTCSVLRDENDRQIMRFLEETADAEEIPINAGWGVSTGAGRQLLPTDQGPDGFYFAVLRKNPS